MEMIFRTISTRWFWYHDLRLLRTASKMSCSGAVSHAYFCNIFSCTYPRLEICRVYSSIFPRLVSSRRNDTKDPPIYILIRWSIQCLECDDRWRLYWIQILSSLNFKGMEFLWPVSWIAPPNVGDTVLYSISSWYLILIYICLLGTRLSISDRQYNKFQSMDISSGRIMFTCQSYMYSVLIFQKDRNK